MASQVIPKLCAFGLLIIWASYAATNTYISALALAGAFLIVLIYENKYPK